MTLPARKRNLTSLKMLNQKFGRLKVIAVFKPAPQNRIKCKCLCDCGCIKILDAWSVRSGHIKSCGCFQNDVRIKCHTKHGDCISYLYNLWTSIKRRCTNPNSIDYHLYGGRGISMYPKWKYNYSTFRTYVLKELGERPSNKHSLDRIRNNEDYKPGNIRWATQTQQSRNTRKNVSITFRGRTLLLIEWAEKTGMKYSTLIQRIKTFKSLKKVFTQPVRRENGRAEFVPNLSWLISYRRPKAHSNSAPEKL